LSFPAASVPAPQSIERLLVIRRDNIGDLVCTTPLIAALRRRFPRARICALVNSYNLPVLEGNPDLDAVYAYTKAKHRPPGTGILSVYWDRLRVMLALRRERFDYAIIAGARAPPNRCGHPLHLAAADARNRGYFPAAGAARHRWPATAASGLCGTGTSRRSTFGIARSEFGPQRTHDRHTHQRATSEQSLASRQFRCADAATP
jgi:hypothetical protein